MAEKVAHIEGWIIEPMEYHKENPCYDEGIRYKKKRLSHISSRIHDDVITEIEKALGIKILRITNDSCEEYKSPRIPYADHEHSQINYTVSTIPPMFIQLHVSDKQITLDDAIDYQILSAEGMMSIVEADYGYSEFTIMYSNLETFTIGGHNLDTILRSHVGKYFHLVMTFKDEEWNSLEA